MSGCVQFVPLSQYDWSLHPALRPVPLPWNPTAYCLIAAFCGVSLWMSIELTIQIFFTFKRRKSLYFWSLLICTWGIVGHVLGLILKLFNEGDWIISSIIFKIGWVSNVTGFSLVLYSRLNLVVRNRKILRTVLCMICVDAVCFHTPIIIFDFGISSPHPNVWYMPMIVMEKIQVIGFSIQETIISMIYIYHARTFLKDVYTRQTHKVMQLLIFAQVMAICFDIILVTVDCNDMFTLKIIIHPFAYAIKLKMEFVVLNQLLALIKHGFAPSEFPAPDEESPDISGPTTVRSGRHGPFSHIDNSVTEHDEKPDPDPTVIVRDMEGTPVIAGHMERMPPALTWQSTGDTILPTAPTPMPTAPASVPPLQPVEQKVSPMQQNEEPHMPARSLSDPMPLNLAQRDQDAIDRRYLGRFGMEHA